ncbi:Universal stress protein a-like protein [Thalictrum thalictroides]|uniref:Universal stress protein a-like protein n=1 Tax=Thalictrum thalictroides TaxID=46969 RepID=A0A7J6X143_THATH|nr:Universal stress protein a-like protein [Thalictrum thalictroides]
MAGASASARVESDPTRIMMAVNQSTIKGYPHASISSKGAFEWTLEKIIRTNTTGFKLLFLHVQVPDQDGFGVNARKRTGWLDTRGRVSGFDEVDSIYASPEDFKELKRRDRARGVHLLEYFVRRCHEIRVSCEAWIKIGDPNQVICHEVIRVRPDFLVVGCRGLGPFQKVFVGTVSEFCQKHVECPVIVIKRKPNEMPQDPVDD